MFMKPIVRANFNVWDPQNKVLFSKKEPLGKNKVRENIRITSYVLIVLSRLEKW